MLLLRSALVCAVVAAVAHALSDVGRRRALRAPVAAITALLADRPAYATRYVSGKNPAGKQEGDKGTRRDGGYLRCLSQCASTCERAGGGLGQKTRAECLNSCRDECCATYEQCTYSIPGT